ncbi:hypothetical protein [Sphingomonas oligophenolica]|nr:hypothetical protein [Sphingomonas oligophenolica]
MEPHRCAAIAIGVTDLPISAIDIDDDLGLLTVAIDNGHGMVRKIR